MSTTPTPGAKKPMGKLKKVTLWIGGSIAGLLALIIVIALVSIANEPDEPTAEQPPAAVEQSAEPTEAAASEEPADEEEPVVAVEEEEPADDGKLSDEELAATVEKNWLNGLGGLDSFQARLGESDTLIGYISQISPISSDTVRVTVQIPSGDMSREEKALLKPELETVARGCLNLGGYDLPQLERCEVETADIDMIESLSR